MDYYVEIRVLPDPEFKEAVLVNALFAKLHRAFVSVDSTNIGVSFPEVGKKSLGNLLRLHGTQLALDNLMMLDWLKGLRDYTIATTIQPVPLNIKYRVVRRVQAKSNAERLRRRSVVKGWLTEAEAEQKISFDKQQKLNLPFAQLKSLSTQQNFRLFIQHGRMQDQPVLGKFNAYGLSCEATVPWF